MLEKFTIFVSSKGKKKDRQKKIKKYKKVCLFEKSFLPL